MSHIYPVYSLFPIELVRGKLTKVYDSDGVEYTDFYGGHAVISIGHAQPTFVERLQSQISRLSFYSNSVINSLQEMYADSLVRASGYDDYDVFMINSGAEANENAVKLASFHSKKSRFIAFEKAFHGRTTGVAKLTDNPKIVAPYGEQLQVTRLPLNDATRVEEELKKGDVAGVIIEGILGIAGVITPHDKFLRELRALCTQYDTVLILDEVQSGFGRTGQFFAHQHAGIKADIVSCAKGMGNGFPVGCILISPEFKASKGQLGTTFGGNQLACTAAQAVLDIMATEDLMNNATEVGDYIRERAEHYFHEDQIHGRGLMVGLDLNKPIAPVREKLVFDHKIFTGSSSNPHILRLLPPLGISMDEVDIFFHALLDILNHD